MNPLIGMPQGMEWLIILAIVILVFGAAKLPDLARGTGQALRIFKTETKGLRDDDDTTPPAELPPTSTTQSPTQSPAAEAAQQPAPEVPSDKHTG